MNPTPPVPRTSTPKEENVPDRSNPAADTSDGLVDAESAEKFLQTVEQRLSEPDPEEVGTEEHTADADDDDNLVSVDNPE